MDIYEECESYYVNFFIDGAEEEQHSSELDSIIQHIPSAFVINLDEVGFKGKADATKIKP